MNNLFKDKLQIINIGLQSFKDTLDLYNVPSVQVDWRPSFPLTIEQEDLFAQKKPLIDAANTEAINKISQAHPFLIKMGLAAEIIPGMNENLILHAGPPITWERMCGPMQGAIIGALIYEGRAKDENEAKNLAASGKIKFAPCHEYSSVGPMAGIISPSMPVFVIQNTTHGNLAYTTMNEGLGKVLRYGAYSPEVIEKLIWMKNVLYPHLQKALVHCQQIDLKSLIAQALHMGDEVHNRNRAGTSLLYRILAPAILDSNAGSKDISRVLNFINGNDHFFLNLSMAAAKASLDVANGIKNSSIVFTMARNGTDFGIRIAGTGNTWFTDTAEIPDALFFPGFTKDDANPDIGDSAITETLGLGGFSMAAAPAIVQFVGGSAKDALNYSREMYMITHSAHPVFQIPALDFAGTPLGIDLLKIADLNILPVINTGVAHKKPGIGQIGAGVLRAPAGPFRKAIETFAMTLNK